MTAELPRCVMCRTKIQPSVPVTFRSDGRVAHVHCPKVLCPICAGEITAQQPIRRDGEAMVHGNCWLRRERQGVQVLNGRVDVAPLIRGKLASGALPAMTPTKVWGSMGADMAACAGCGETLRGGTEYEVEFAGAVSVRFHRVCYGIWEEERLKISGGGISGGSAPSAWTLFFDLGLATRVCDDGAAFEEMLIASAEVRAASAAGRDGAARVRARSLALRATSQKLFRRSSALLARA